MKLALFSTAQHVSDVNTSIYRSYRLLVALCRLVGQLLFKSFELLHRHFWRSVSQTDGVPRLLWAGLIQQSNQTLRKCQQQCPLALFNVGTQNSSQLQWTNTANLVLTSVFYKQSSLNRTCWYDQLCARWWLCKVCHVASNTPVLIVKLGSSLHSARFLKTKNYGPSRRRSLAAHLRRRHSATTQSTAILKHTSLRTFNLTFRRVVHVEGRADNQTDKHHEINGRFLKFCERTM